MCSKLFSIFFSATYVYPLKQSSKPIIIALKWQFLFYDVWKDMSSMQAIDSLSISEFWYWIGLRVFINGKSPPRQTSHHTQVGFSHNCLCSINELPSPAVFPCYGNESKSRILSLDDWFKWELYWIFGLRIQLISENVLCKLMDLNEPALWCSSQYICIEISHLIWTCVGYRCWLKGSNLHGEHLSARTVSGSMVSFARGSTIPLPR